MIAVRVAWALFFWMSPCVFAVPLSCGPTQNITWQCPIRCYKQPIGQPQTLQWIDAKAQDLLVCSANSRDLQGLLDRHCDSMYADDVTAGWEVRAQIFFPFAPGSLVGCSAIGEVCGSPGIEDATWQCPARCSNGISEYSTTFSFCAMDRPEALAGGLQYYRTEGPQPLCAKGYELLPHDGPYDQDVVCGSTAKACSCAG